MTKEEFKAFCEEGVKAMTGGKLVITAEEDGINVDSTMTYMGSLLGAGSIIGKIMEDVGPSDIPLVAQLVYSGIVTGHDNEELGKADTMLFADILYKAVHSEPEEELKL